MKSRNCVICDHRPALRGSFCIQCNESYDRARRGDDGTILAAIEWAAKRSRRFAHQSQAATMRGLRERLERLVGSVSKTITMTEENAAVPATALPSRNDLRTIIETLLRSARPHPVEHPTMWKAWGNACKVLKLDDRAFRTPRSEP